MIKEKRATLHHGQGHGENFYLAEEFMNFGVIQYWKKRGKCGKGVENRITLGRIVGLMTILYWPELSA